MADLALAVADALATELDNLIDDVTVTREYVVDLEIKDLPAKTIKVVPAAETIELQDNWQNLHRVTLDISVILKVDNTKASRDAAMHQTAAITELYDADGQLRRMELAGAEWAGLLERDPIWDQERLAEASVLQSLIRVTYQAYL